MKIKFSSICDKDDFELTIYTDPTWRLIQLNLYSVKQKNICVFR